MTPPDELRQRTDGIDEHCDFVYRHISGSDSRNLVQLLRRVMHSQSRLEARLEQIAQALDAGADDGK